MRGFKARVAAALVANREVLADLRAGVSGQLALVDIASVLVGKVATVIFAIANQAFVDADLIGALELAFGTRRIL